MSKPFEWDANKNAKLKKERGITFETVVQAIANDGLLDNIQHPTRSNQKMFVVEIHNYAYIIPYVDAKDRIFLKTIYPSRKHTKKYLEEI
ncbi:MAG: toxin [Deltaproteobacteria bacterium]|jgi:uncharacterized DUF497 family protein|nr:toxin [Deltaproteobacteria bacterium]